MTDSRDNIIVEKSERFADRITKMYRYLSEKRSGDKDMLKQIVQSGTSVGANVSAIIKDSEEIISILTIITKTTKENLKNEGKQ